MVSISVRSKLSILKILNFLLLFIYTNATIIKIYPVTAKTNQTNTTNLTQNSPIPDSKITLASVNSETSDPVAQKILQLFAASILAFGTLVADPHNPSNIKSALFSMATCWYKIFMTATAPETR
jgi:hypothetical protein